VIACRKNFFVPVKVLSRYFRHRFLSALQSLYDTGQLQFFGDLKSLEHPAWFEEHLRALKKIDWVVYAKPPMAGPEAVLKYLSRYTHRIAISNRRLLRFDEHGVTFRYKDDRDGKTRWKSMTLATDEFIRRFLQHVLPKGFHRIRHYGLYANAQRNAQLTLARKLLHQPEVKQDEEGSLSQDDKCTFTCRQCGTPLIIVETLLPEPVARAPPQQCAA